MKHYTKPLFSWCNDKLQNLGSHDEKRSMKIRRGEMWKELRTHRWTQRQLEMMPIMSPLVAYKKDKNHGCQHFLLSQNYFQEHFYGQFMFECIELNATFIPVSVITRWPVHLSMLSSSFCYQWSKICFPKHEILSHINIIKTNVRRWERIASCSTDCHQT